MQAPAIDAACPPHHVMAARKSHSPHQLSVLVAEGGQDNNVVLQGREEAEWGSQGAISKPPGLCITSSHLAHWGIHTLQAGYCCSSGKQPP